MGICITPTRSIDRASNPTCSPGTGRRRLLSLPGPLLASLLRLPLASVRSLLELPQHALVRLAGMEVGGARLHPPYPIWALAS